LNALGLLREADDLGHGDRVTFDYREGGAIYTVRGEYLGLAVTDGGGIRLIVKGREYEYEYDPHRISRFKVTRQAKIVWDDMLRSAAPTRAQVERASRRGLTPLLTGLYECERCGGTISPADPGGRGWWRCPQGCNASA
jgi:hypothetical protein